MSVTLSTKQMIEGKQRSTPVTTGDAAPQSRVKLGKVSLFMAK
jgi:hypothetical protein